MLDSYRITKYLAIIIAPLIVVWIGGLILFGGLGMISGSNPFYIVASGSMIPELQVHDVVVVLGIIPFEDIEIGDIIVFNRPSDHNKVIVHRVVTVLDDDPKTLRTKGDANTGSIPGTDSPITEEEYLGKVIVTIPQVGWILQFIQPPVNFIIIIGIVIVSILIFRHRTNH